MKKLVGVVFLAVLFGLTLFVSCGMLPPDVDYVDFTVTAENRHMVGYTGEENEDLVIPATFQHGEVWYQVVEIGEYAFLNCKNLNSVSIPNGVTSIAMCAFSQCSNMTDVNISNSVKTIELSAFIDCDGLTEVTLLGVTTIGNSAFSCCANLKSVTFGNALIKIDDSAFFATYLSNV